MTHPAEASGDTFTCLATLIRLHWRLPAIGLGLAILGCVAVMLRVSIEAGVFAVILGAGMVLATSMAKVWPQYVSMTVRANRKALTIGNAPPIPVDSIVEVHTQHVSLGESEIHVTLANGARRCLHVNYPDDMRLLDALGLGAGERRASFPLQLSFSSRLIPCVMLVAIVSLARLRPPVVHDLVGMLLHILGLLLVLLSVSSLLAWLVGAVWRGQLVIGADGFALHWPLRRPRFTSFREVAAVERPHRWFRQSLSRTLVQLRSGRSLPLFARDSRLHEDLHETEADALHRHLVDAAHRAIMRGAGETELSGLLAHPSASAWLASLDTLEPGDEGRYRVVAPSTALLVAALDDGSLTTRARAAAAVALLRLGDEESRQAVRIASRRCAQPDLRRALLDLEQAEDDRGFADVLASVEAPARRRAP